MSEEAEGAISTGLQFASAFDGGFGIGAVIGFALSRRAKKKRKKAEKLARKQKADTMLSAAYERGRITRKKAATDRSKYAGAGVSTRSGSAAAGEGGTVREGIYQSSAMLAGLPKDHKMRNPAMFGMS